MLHVLLPHTPERTHCNVQCNAEDACFTCAPGAEGCAPVKTYRRLRVNEHGRVSGRAAMKNEIHKRGPISCVIDATAGLDAYEGGIYTEKKANAEENHIISVVGWGVEDGEEFWIVRNSWGEPWGERGFFRIVTSKFRNGTGDEYNLVIEKDCGWAMPSEWVEWDAALDAPVGTAAASTEALAVEE